MINITTGKYWLYYFANTIVVPYQKTMNLKRILCLFLLLFLRSLLVLLSRCFIENERFLSCSVADDGSEVILKKGDAVKVIRASEKRGYLVIEHKNTTLHLPFQVMELKV